MKKKPKYQTHKNSIVGPDKNAEKAGRIRSALDQAGQIRGNWRAGTFIMVVFAATVLFVGLFYVWSRMQLVQIGYEITELERKNRELKKRKRELTLELASLEAPANLEKKAREKAGLIFPPINKVVHVP